MAAIEENGGGSRALPSAQAGRRDSSCAKYARNPGAPAAFALVTALRRRVCKTVGCPCVGSDQVFAASAAFAGSAKGAALKAALRLLALG